MECGAPLGTRAGPGSHARSPGLIIDFDDVRPPRGPRRRVAAAAGLGLAILGAGLWLVLSSAGASSSSPRRAPQAPAAAESAPPSPQPSPPPQPAVPSGVTTPAKVALLSLDAVPWGNVYVDGRPVGTTPLVDLPLAPGAHNVRVERAGYRPYERVIDAAPGQRVRISGIALQEE